MTTPATVRVVAGATTRELRRAVLRAHQAPTDPLPGDGLAEAVHFAVHDDGTEGRPLAACFLFQDEYPWPADDDSGAPPADHVSWHLRAVAVDPYHQGTGLGRTLMAAVVEYIAEHGGGVLWCDARTTALAFYRKLDFRTYGAEHVSGGLDHFYMWRLVEQPESGQRPVEVGEQVLGVLDADREPDEVGGHLER